MRHDRFSFDDRARERRAATGAGGARLVAAVRSVEMALALGERGQHAEAGEALLNVASSYENEHDPTIRVVAASALALRVGELLKSHDFTAARAGWQSLRESYGRDPDPRVRAEVAFGGTTTALGLLASRHADGALATTEEVIALYRNETDPHIRANVAVALWARGHELLCFLGSNPEPEVIEALRIVTPDAEELVRRAQEVNRAAG